MKTTTDEDCEKCQTVKRYENKWRCVICYQEFIPKEKTLEDKLKRDYGIFGHGVQGGGTG